jgi:hypothetical protein
VTSPVIDQSSQINGNANLDEGTALVPHVKAVVSLNMASGALSKEKMGENIIGTISVAEPELMQQCHFTTVRTGTGTVIML